MLEIFKNRRRIAFFEKYSFAKTDEFHLTLNNWPVLSLFNGFVRFVSLFHNRLICISLKQTLFWRENFELFVENDKNSCCKCPMSRIKTYVLHFITFSQLKIPVTSYFFKYYFFSDDNSSFIKGNWFLVKFYTKTWNYFN